jgi:hypothetical protein
MEPTLFLIFAFVQAMTALGGHYYLTAAKRRRLQSWFKAATAAGLEGVTAETARWSTGILTGRARSHRVRLEDSRTALQLSTEGRGPERVRLTIEGLTGITLRAEDTVRDFERYAGPRETEIGDAAFDREVYVHGSPERLRAALDVETRRLLRPVLQGRIAAAGAPGSSIWAGVTIRDGDIVAEFGEVETSQLLAHFSAALETLLVLADRLAPPTGVVAQIIDNTRDEPEWRVRMENILLLVRQFPRHPATPAALEIACQDERQEVQLEAALSLGPEKAEATLREIACAEHSADPLAARAIVALDRRLTREQLQGVLSHALRTRRHETARTCLVALGNLGGPAVVEPLAKVLALLTGELAALAARALGATRAEAAEAPLLAALESSASDVRVAAAEALGRVGRAGAVLPLKEIAGQNRVDTALRKAARESIAEIQSRLSGASPGQISLAAPESGHLSLVDEPHGRVSLTEDE